MEREVKVLNLEEEAKNIADFFAGELNGYQLDAPSYKLVFNHNIQEYIPAIVVRVSRNGDEQFLVSSPLSNQNLLCFSGTFLDIVDYTKKYQKGYMESSFVKSEEGDWTLQVSLNVKNKQLCNCKEKALKMLDAFLVFTFEDNVRKQVFQMLANGRFTFKPCFIFGELCWGAELSKNKKNNRIKLLVVDVEDSSIKTVEFDESQYEEIEFGRRCKTLSGKVYFYNGKAFSSVENNSEYMTITEAQEVYNNTPKYFRESFASYVDGGFLPVVCCHQDFSYVIAENRKATPPSLLIMDSRIGMITDFNVNIDKTVIPHKVGAKFANDGNPVELTANGWSNQNK